MRFTTEPSHRATRSAFFNHHECTYGEQGCADVRSFSQIALSLIFVSQIQPEEIQQPECSNTQVPSDTKPPSPSSSGTPTDTTRKRKRKRHSKKRPQLYFPEPIPPQLMDPPSSRYHFGAYVSKARIIEVFAEYCGERDPELEEGEPGWDELVFFEAILHQGWGAQSLLGLCDVELWHKAQYKDIASAYDTDESVYVGVVRIEDGKGKQLLCSDTPALTVNKDIQPEQYQPCSSPQAIPNPNLLFAPVPSFPSRPPSTRRANRNTNTIPKTVSSISRTPSLSLDTTVVARSLAGILDGSKLVKSTRSRISGKRTYRR
ncbi:hypothetical protein BXZ70DRAFT_444149 [Cristinia sonorae]|uniref:Uncharacterized protein n=1 Tax=Cristinia sonorae TaxID=1940300 RepID=A0A8K0UJL6_9AGAR|nr:hypothetical protein BXZ70DRAFT_444149 [Cristinia sonorae]